MEPRRWKAFLRLKGQTLADSEDDILKEFTGFVSALNRIGVEYSIIVDVESGRMERFNGRTGAFHTVTQNAQPRRQTDQEFGR